LESDVKLDGMHSTNETSELDTRKRIARFLYAEVIDTVIKQSDTLNTYVKLWNNLLMRKTMIAIALAIAIVCIFYYIVPFAYTWLGWNYFLPTIFACSLFFNYTMTLILLAVYWVTPKPVIDECLQYILTHIREMNKDFFQKMESNIRKTFLITVTHPIPEKSIRIWSPHGVNAVSVGIHNGFRITDKKLPGSKVITHIGAQYFPIFRDILRQIHCISSDYHEIRKTLETESITVVLGGVNEMRRVKPKHLELVVKKRKGIFKLALETGTPIVPVLTYGENEIFPEMKHDILCWINDMLYEYLRIAIPFPSYTSVRNWASLTTKPLDPIHTYTGKPIYVKKIEQPTEKHIRALRNVYIKRLEELFAETNSGEFSLSVV
jgi:hypothetical protein